MSTIAIVRPICAAHTTVYWLWRDKRAEYREVFLRARGPWLLFASPTLPRRCLQRSSEIPHSLKLLTFCLATGLLVLCAPICVAVASNSWKWCSVNPLKPSIKIIRSGFSSSLTRKRGRLDSAVCITSRHKTRFSGICVADDKVGAAHFMFVFAA